MEAGQNQQDQKNNPAFYTEADQVAITYYTDPLCCWSWAMEPHLRKLRKEFKDFIHWRYCMGGLIPSWKNFVDPLNSVNRPAQMGPIWMEASHISGVPIHYKIWMENPPASSYPACIAVKCVELQSAAAGEQYLSLARTAVMTEGRNIALMSELLQIADLLSQKQTIAFDISRFKEDMKNDKGLEAFRKDLEEVNNRNIKRFPTLVFRRPNHNSLIITGYRPYEALADVMKQIAPDLIT